MVISFIHWGVYAYYVYLFGYASLFKVFEKDGMMQNMSSLGFNRAWTLVIGYGELAGVLALLAGIAHHGVKNAAVLWLFPFAIGALMVHFAHHEYKHFYGALFGCIAAVILLATDRHFKLIL